MPFLAFLLLLIIGLLAYIRLAPSSASKWHKLPDARAPGDTSQLGGFITVRKINAPASKVLKAVEQRALATPRTRLIAGGVAEGMLTFQTRSLLIGFPDYTTASVKGDLLVIHGRLRFGRSDLGVNRARIAEWLETLEPLTERL